MITEIEKNSNPELIFQEIKKSSIQDFRNNIKKWLHFEDKDAIDIILSGMVAEKVGGDPLWLFFIAPPGGSKTELLRSFSNPEFFHHISDMTSKTLVSGLMISDETKMEDGTKKSKSRKVEDLLPQINGKTLIFKDFTTILEKGRDERREIIAQFRECYDGIFNKKFGSIDKTISYKSRFGIVAGVTPIIDKHWKVMQQLGERFLKVRLSEDADEVTKRARINEGYEEVMRRELQENADKFILSLDFKEIPKFDDDLFGDFICKIAKFIAHARTPISFNESADNFYFEYIPTPEVPTRLVKQLKKMAKCLALIRGYDKVTLNEIKTLLRVAKDTIPQDRLVILEVISRNQNQTLEGCTRSSIYAKLNIPETSIRRILAQLKTLDLIIETKKRELFNNYEQEIYYYKTNALWGDIFGGVPEMLEGRAQINSSELNSKETKRC